MKVARNTSHPLRHDWLNATDEKGRVQVSLLAHRNEVHVNVTLDGKEYYDYLTLREVAELLMSKSP